MKAKLEATFRKMFARYVYGIILIILPLLMSIFFSNLLLIYALTFLIFTFTFSVFNVNFIASRNTSWFQSILTLALANWFRPQFKIQETSAPSKTSWIIKFSIIVALAAVLSLYHYYKMQKIQCTDNTTIASNKEITSGLGYFMDLDTINSSLTNNQKRILGDNIWFDANSNSKKDSEENGINGVKVELYAFNKNGELELRDKTYTRNNDETTSEDGYYSFYTSPGQYYLKFILPENLKPIIPSDKLKYGKLKELANDIQINNEPIINLDNKQNQIDG